MIETYRRYLKIAGASALAGMAVGCATPGYQQAEKTASSMQATRSQVVAAGQQVMRTTATLDRMAKTTGDLRPTYNQFVKDVKAIESLAGSAKWRADSYRKNASLYLDQWSQELAGMANDNIRATSAQRRAQVQAKFGAIERAAANTRRAYVPLLQDLTGMVQYLGQDLTVNSVAALQPQVKSAQVKAVELRRTMNELVRELDRVSGTLAPQAQ